MITKVPLWSVLKKPVVDAARKIHAAEIPTGSKTDKNCTDLTYHNMLIPMSQMIKTSRMKKRAREKAKTM